jgi:hypothetical protein
MKRRTKLERLQNAFAKKKPIVVAFPPNSVPIKPRKKPKLLQADCGHEIITGASQRLMAGRLPTCCVVCAFLAGMSVYRIHGMEDIAFD